MRVVGLSTLASISHTLSFYPEIIDINPFAHLCFSSHRERFNTSKLTISHRICQKTTKCIFIFEKGFVPIFSLKKSKYGTGTVRLESAALERSRGERRALFALENTARGNPARLALELGSPGKPGTTSEFVMRGQSATVRSTPPCNRGGMWQ